MQQEKYCTNCYNFSGVWCTSEGADICRWNEMKNWKPYPTKSCDNCKFGENTERCKMCKERVLENGRKYSQWDERQQNEKRIEFDDGLSETMGLLDRIDNVPLEHKLMSIATWVTRKELNVLRENIKSIEWSGGHTTCPACGKYNYGKVHSKDCWLAKLIDGGFE